MARKQIQKPARKALTSGRIKSGEVIEGDIILPAKAPLADKTRDIFQPPAGLRFDATPWNTSRRTFDTDVDKLLAEIDAEMERLGIVAQRDRDGIQARHISASVPTSAYPVVTKKV